MKSMTVAEFREALATSGISTYGYEDILNLISFCLRLKGDRERKKGYASIANMDYETSDSLYRILCMRGYYDHENTHRP